MGLRGYLTAVEAAGYCLAVETQTYARCKTAGRLDTLAEVTQKREAVVAVVCKTIVGGMVTVA